MKKQKQQQTSFGRGKGMYIILGIVIILGILIFGDIPTRIQVYKHTQSAKVSLVNDDLEGALISYEKAYELANKEALTKDMVHTKNLIESKSNFIKAEKFAQESHVDSAYLYYGKVIKEDKVRFEQAQLKLNEMAEKIVDNIYEQAEELYDNHLFPMVIGRLQLALDYNVKVDETEKYMTGYKSHFYDYYLNKALVNVEKFFNNEMFYNNFVKDLENASLYAQTDDEVKKIQELQAVYISETVNQYLELAKMALEVSDNALASSYLEMIQSLDESNTEAKQLLENLNVE